MSPNLECPGGVESQQIPDLILSNSQNLSKSPAKSWSLQRITRTRLTLFNYSDWGRTDLGARVAEIALLYLNLVIVNQFTIKDCDFGKAKCDSLH